MLGDYLHSFLPSWEESPKFLAFAVARHLHHFHLRLGGIVSELSRFVYEPVCM